MNIIELYEKLIKLKIPFEKYYLHGLFGSTNDDEKLSLSIKKGKYNIEYQIYYKERGEKHSVKIFTSEDEACRYFYKNMKETKEIEEKLGL